jgi:hypothetical protein
MRGGPLVVVGDTLLDVDLHGTVGRVAPDAPDWPPCWPPGCAPGWAEPTWC